MPVLGIQKWLGLDTRRSELTSNLGVLETLQDAHINQGSEIEKRKSFALISAFSNNVFGLETGTSLFAFGSAAIGSVTVPAGVTYIQCAHPSDPGKSMTAVLCSCDFAGVPFCVAKFGTEVYWYLDGNVIGASIAGQVLTTYSYNTLTVPGGASTNVSDGDTVTVGSQVYRFKITMSQAYDVQIGPSINGSLFNLTLAWQGLGVGGLNWYGTGGGGATPIPLTGLSVTILPGYIYVNGITITDNTPGNNAIVTTTTSTALAWLQGTMIYSQSLSQIAAQMYTLLSGTAWSNAGIFVENLTSTGFNIYTSYGVTWSPVTSVTTAGSGTLTTALVNNGIAPISAGTGSAQLTLFAGSKGGITAINDTVGTKVYKFLNSPVPWDSSINTTLNDLATAVGTEVPATLTALSVAPATVSVSTNVLNIGTTDSGLASNYLTVSVESGSGCDLCFDNMFFDCSGVTALQTLHNIYVSSGTNLVPYARKYSPTGISYANPRGYVSGGSAFVAAYGTYLWVPGANDNSLVVQGTPYLAINYPNGVVFNFTSGSIEFGGHVNATMTVSLYAMTDILASSGGLPLGGAFATIATQLGNIANAINANNTAYVASNQAAVLPATGANTSLYISRRTININSSAYSGLYFYIGTSAINGISPGSFAAIIAPSSFGISSATAAVNGRGTTYSVTFGGTWLAGDQYVFDIVTPSVTYTAGVGLITQLAASACLTLSNRVHVVSGPYWNGSDNGDATQWEQQAPGAFQVDVTQYFQQADNLVSLAAYQGRIALFANYTILIWGLDANPANISLLQAMANIGTFCPLGPQSLGDLDVVFPSVTGLRSLRVRDLSLNAYVNDLGSPVDSLVQADVDALGLQNLSATCAIVEPSANRYWCYLNGHIYVLSYFPSAKILAAWSLYTPTYFVGGVSTTFVPIKFVIFQSQVYFLASSGGTNYLFVFGGANNTTYDATDAIAATPWLDFGSPDVRKQVSSIDFAMTNSWQFSGLMDYYGYVNNSARLKLLTTTPLNNVSFQLGSYAIDMDGFHIKLEATCYASGYSVLSALNVNYTKREQKK